VLNFSEWLKHTGVSHVRVFGAGGLAKTIEETGMLQFSVRDGNEQLEPTKRPPFYHAHFIINSCHL
jgi:hypothetical protein